MNLSPEIKKWEAIVKKEQDIILRIIFEADNIELYTTQLKQHQFQVEVSKQKIKRLQAAMAILEPNAKEGRKSQATKLLPLEPPPQLNIPTRKNPARTCNQPYPVVFLINDNI